MRSLRRAPEIYCPDGSLRITQTSRGLAIQVAPDPALLTYTYDSGTDTYTCTANFEPPAGVLWATDGDTLTIARSASWPLDAYAITVSIQVTDTRRTAADSYHSFRIRLVAEDTAHGIASPYVACTEPPLYQPICTLSEPDSDSPGTLTVAALNASISDVWFAVGIWSAIPIGFLHGQSSGGMTFVTARTTTGMRLLQYDQTFSSITPPTESFAAGDIANGTNYLWISPTGSLHLSAASYPPGANYVQVAKFEADASGNMLAFSCIAQVPTVSAAAYSGTFPDNNGHVVTVTDGIITGGP